VYILNIDFLGGGFKNFFVCSPPKNWGNHSQVDVRICFNWVGKLNHQLGFHDLHSEKETSPGVSGTQNGGTEPYKSYKAILGIGFPLHKPYPYSLYR